MKNSLKIGSILFVVLSLFSCAEFNNIEMVTTINTDGSCSRYLEVKVDSSYFNGNHAENPFPFMMDSTWSISTSEFIDSTFVEDSVVIKRTYKAKATKDFQNVMDIGSTFYFDDEVWDSLVPDVYFEKQFQWFYTYFHYREVYPSINTLETIPIQDFLDDQEIKTWFGEDKTLYVGKSGSQINDMLSDIEYKVNQWLSKNYYAELFNFYADHYSYFDKIPVDSITFRNLRDSIFTDNYDLFESIDDEYKMMDSLMQSYFNEKVSFDAQNKLESQLEEQLETMFGFVDYFPRTLDYALILPGKILHTNAATFEEGELRWKVDAYKFFINDYVLEAQSKKVNYWAFALSGLIILLAIGSFFIRRKGN